MYTLLEAYIFLFQITFKLLEKYVYVCVMLRGIVGEQAICLDFVVHRLYFWK